MKKKIIALLLIACTLATLSLTGCNIVDTTEVVDGADMSDEEREAYIIEKMVADGKILEADDYTKVTDETAGSDHTTGMSLVYSDDNFDFYIDFTTTQFAIKDKRGETSIMYHSAPNRWCGAKSLGTVDYSSSLAVEAYDASNKKYEFTTNANCIEDEDYFKIVQMGEGWYRFIYTIGNDADKELCPSVLRKETYTEIMLKLNDLLTEAEESGDADRIKEVKAMVSDMKDLYKGIGPEEETNEELSYLVTTKDSGEISDPTKITALTLEETELYAKYYPIITVRPLYVLRGSTSKRQKENIRDVMNAVGFTVSDLKDEMDAVEYNGPSRAVLYTIPLDVKINEDGLSIEVDSSLILGPTEQKLYKISVCTYFGGDLISTGNEYIVYPDGCGSYYSFAGAMYETTQRQRIYGIDDTFAEQIVTEVTEDVCAGYLVMNRDTNGGFLAYMEQGASHAFVRATNGRKGNNIACPTCGYEIVYIERNFRTYETSSSSSKTSSTDGTSSEVKSSETTASGVITSKYRINTVFKMRYILDEVGETQKTYAEYAKQLRTLLQENGKFPTEKLDSQNLTFYLELLGAIDREEEVAGFPITVKAALTTYEQVLEIVNELAVEGISGEDVVVKYTYWANGGVQNTAANEVRLLSELGTEDQLKKLVNTLAEEKVGFYPTVDFMYVVKDTTGDDFTTTDTSSRTLDMSIARVGYRGLATGSFSETYQKVVTPAVIAKYAVSYEKSYKNTVGASTIALAGFGTKLNSDYRNNAVYTRLAALDEQIKAVETYTDNGYTVMGEGANDYAWAYAKYLTNVPTGGSEYMNSSYAIPFVQIVLHGYIDYSTTALNLTGDYQTALLLLLETGSGVHFEWCYADDSVFDKTDFPYHYFSRNYSDSFENAVALYKEAAALLDNVADQEIVGHEKVEANIESPYIGDIDTYVDLTLTATDGVFMTTYENGLQIVVNYNNYNIELEDAERTTVKAYSYIYREGADAEWQE